ncbi:MAG: arylsulfatase [Isosphaeraceae bacterium]
MTPGNQGNRTWPFAFGLLILLTTNAATLGGERPNLVYILADDLGYGDVGAMNTGSKIATPNIDRLAAEGMVFTDAHSGSAVCTPTRYGIMTGRYAWRSRLQSGVLGGYSPPLIKPDRLTVASLLSKNGYRTACVGKWHLGLDWTTTKPVEFGDAVVPKGGTDTIDYTKAIKGGPLALGFDSFFGITASLDMSPFVFIRDDHSVGVATTTKTIVRKGPAAEDFEAVNVLPSFTTEAVAFLDGQAGKPQPFFLYLPLSAPHAPIVPSDEFKGKSGLGPYGDFVMQVDATVGRVLDALNRNSQEQNTLVVFTSDNGCSPTADFPTLAKHDHYPSGPLRGHKADIFEGGHRIPFLARWPGKIKAGSTCADTICLTDLMATCADILDLKLPDDAGEDSVSILPDLLDKASGPLREATVHHSINGSFAIRQGHWLLVLCSGSGGWSPPRPGRDATKGLPPLQLFDLRSDLGQRRNLEAEHPEIVERLTRLLERYVSEGRSTPGTPLTNEKAVQIHKRPA